MRSGRVAPARPGATARRSLSTACDRYEALFRSGDFDILLEAVQPVITKVIRRFKGLSPEDRQDACQIASLHLYGEWTSGKTYGTTPVIAVVRSRTAFVVKDMFAYASRPKEHGFSVTSLDYTFAGAEERDDAARAIPDASAGPEEVVLDAECVEAALKGLTANERRVAYLRCVEGLSSAQTGENLGLLANAVDQTYYRARRKMLDNLREFYGEGHAT